MKTKREEYTHLGKGEGKTIGATRPHTPPYVTFEISDGIVVGTFAI